MKKKICLGIETAGSHLGFALVDFSEKLKVLKTLIIPIQNKQSEEFFVHLDKLLKQSRVTKEDLSLLAVDHGPGSFTGVRVGVAAARAMAQGLDIPVVGVSSLEALAIQSDFLQKEKDGVLVSVIPALPGEVYFSAYRVAAAETRSLLGHRLKEVIAPTWSSEQECELKLKSLTISARTSRDGVPHPAQIAALGINKYVSAGKTYYRYESLVPLYLQPSWAERKLGRPVV